MLLTSTSEVYGDPEVHPQKETYWGHVNPIGTYVHTDTHKTHMHINPHITYTFYDFFVKHFLLMLAILSVNFVYLYCSNHDLSSISILRIFLFLRSSCLL